MIFIYITLALAVLDTGLFLLTSIKSAHMFRERYPDLKVPRSHWSDRLLSYIKGGLYIICPIVNFMLAWVLLFDNDDFCERVVQKIHARCVKGVEE